MVTSGCTGDPAEPSGGGNFGAAAALRARLQGRAAPAAAAAPPRKETVVLPQVDAQGRAVPGAFGRDAAGAGGRLINMFARLSCTMLEWRLPTCGRRPQPGMRTADMLQAAARRHVLPCALCKNHIASLLHGTAARDSLQCFYWKPGLLLPQSKAQHCGNAHPGIRGFIVNHVCYCQGR